MSFASEKSTTYTQGVEGEKSITYTQGVEGEKSITYTQGVEGEKSIIDTQGFAGENGSASSVNSADNAIPSNPKASESTISLASPVFSIVMAFSCFSVIPMPTISWDEKNMRYMMAAFPLVGAAIGALVFAWHLLAQRLGFGNVLTGAGYALLPVMVSGGIHLDGFADVMDAQSSHASLERRREILKDPHVGAFAVMGVCCYLIAYFALCCEIDAADVTILACVPVVSRCLSAFATVTFRTASAQGMLAAEQSSASTRTVRGVLAALLAAVFTIMVLNNALVACLMLTFALVTLAAVWQLAKKCYGGMSGDLAGFYLQIAELVMLACIVFTGRLG